MKRALSILLIIIATMLLIGCGTGVAAGGTPKITLDTPALELGDVVNGEVVTREVTVTNTGDGPLVVNSITTSCGCTSASLEPMSIPAGQNGVLTISFDSGAHGPDLTGPLMRRVYLASNDPTQPEAVVELNANIIKPGN